MVEWGETAGLIVLKAMPGGRGQIPTILCVDVLSPGPSPGPAWEGLSPLYSTELETHLHTWAFRRCSRENLEHPELIILYMNLAMSNNVFLLVKLTQF